MLTCTDCGKAMREQRTSLPQGQSVCHPCRAIRRAARPRQKRVTPKKLRCAGCDKPLYRGGGSLPQGQAKCHTCRRAASARTHPCPDCGTRCGGICCGPCSSKRRRIRPDDDRRTTRALRERSAPGLSKRCRDALFAKWRRQGRCCAYCERTADTMDHVIPLVRGGTNFEGNLVPACRSCNSSKRFELVIEWRTRRTMRARVA